MGELITPAGYIPSDLVLRDLLEKYGVRLNVLGKTELLPLSVQEAIHRAEEITRHNTRFAFLIKTSV